MCVGVVVLDNASRDGLDDHVAIEYIVISKRRSDRELLRSDARGVEWLV